MSHALKYNGAPYNENAELINLDNKVTSGEGRALCACGVISPVLATGKARREWFREHKIEALDAEVATQDVEPGTPEDEVADALAELVEPAPTTASLAALLPGVGGKPATVAPKKVSTRRKAELAAGFLPEVGAADEPNAHSHTISFTKAITPGFWRSLGRTATQAMVDALYPTVTVTANNNTRKLTFQGPHDDVEAAVDATKEMWAESLVAVAEWKKQDEGFLGRSTEPLTRRREGYHLTERFFEGFGSTFADWRRSV